MMEYVLFGKKKFYKKSKFGETRSAKNISELPHTFFETFLINIASIRLKINSGGNAQSK